jgi:hypothetical protein
MMLLHLQVWMEEFFVLKTQASGSCAFMVSRMHGITSQNKLIFMVNIE